MYRYLTVYLPALIAAATGVVGGGAGGLLKSDNEKAQVTKNCLRYRGYAVLN